MTDLIPSTIEFYNITPRIHLLFSEVWSTIPTSEREVITVRLELVEGVRRAEVQGEHSGHAGGGVIELVQWRLRPNKWAKHVIAHELAHILLHANIDNDKYALRTEYHSQVETEANKKAKDWGYDNPFLSFGTTIQILTPEESAKIHWGKTK